MVIDNACSLFKGNKLKLSIDWWLIIIDDWVDFKHVYVYHKVVHSKYILFCIAKYELIWIIEHFTLCAMICEWRFDD